MTDLHSVIAGGLFSLGGVILGAFMTPLTQLFLEWKRERRTADRAKLLVGAELLQAQLILRSVSKGGYWVRVEDVNAFLPTSAWRENRSSFAGMVHEDLWNQLVMAYAILETDRSRFLAANKLPANTPLTAEVAEGMKKSAYDLGRLRRQLGIAGGWLDEIDEEFKPRP